jgi:hypothetical protein
LNSTTVEKKDPYFSIEQNLVVFFFLAAAARPPRRVGKVRARPQPDRAKKGGTII